MRHSSRQDGADWQDQSDWQDHSDWHDKADWHWNPPSHDEDEEPFHDSRVHDSRAQDALARHPLDPEGQPRGPSRRGALVGIGSGIFAGLLVAAGALWFTQGSLAFGVPDGKVGEPKVSAARGLDRPVRELAMAAAGTTVTDLSLVISSGALEVDASSIYLTSYAMDGRAFALSSNPDTSARLTGRVVPIPLANPLNRNQMASGDGIRALQQLDAGAVPLPARKPAMPDQRLAYAALPDPATPLSDAPSMVPGSQAPGTDTPLSEDEPPLPTAGSGYAIYDIKAKVVYMPNGDRLEAHSGYGDTFDDVRFVSKRMVGPTPPNTYALTMREALFHGTEAVRLNPVGTGKMYGRAGILAHPYLLGPRGDSNGCVSIKDYDRFLAAFKRGEVKKMIVVVELKNGPKKEENFLLSLLKPR